MLMIKKQRSTEAVRSALLRGNAEERTHHEF